MVVPESDRDRQQVLSDRIHIIFALRLQEAKTPNATTRQAMVELEADQGRRFASVDDLMVDLHADD